MTDVCVFRAGPLHSRQKQSKEKPIKLSLLTASIVDSSFSNQSERPTHLKNYRWRPDSSWWPAWCVWALINTHTHSHGHFMAYGTGKKPKTLDIKTKYGTTTELQWRPLSPWRGCWQHLSLSLCLHLFWSLSPSILYPSLYLTLFSLPSFSPLQLKLKTGRTGKKPNSIKWGHIIDIALSIYVNLKFNILISSDVVNKTD